MALNLNLQLPKRITKKRVEELIKNLDFQKRGYNKYFWFNDKQETSLSGCYLYYNLPTREDKKVLPRKVKLVLNVATYGVRSFEDLEKQNETILSLQKEFGGTIYNPHFKNNQIFENKLPKLSVKEKKLGKTYLNFQNKMESFTKLSQQTISENQDNTQIYSLLIPFLVSVFESFFYEFYVAFLDSSPKLLDEILSNRGRMKVSHYDLKGLASQEKTLGEIEASNFSFQNLYTLDQAYSQLFNFGLYRLWNKKLEYEEKSYTINKVLERLVYLRHKIVHRAFLDETLEQKDLELFEKTIYSSVEEFKYKLEQKKLRIDLKKVLHIKFNPEQKKSQITKNKSTKEKPISKEKPNPDLNTEKPQLFL